MDLQGPTSEPSRPLSSSPLSMPSSPPVMQTSIPYRHAAVRQSSLLRIVHTVGSQPSATSQSSSSDKDFKSHGDEGNGSETEAHEFLRSPTTRTRSYRPRSKTYTFIESEAEPPTPPSKVDDEASNSTPFWHLYDRSGGMTLESEEGSPQERLTDLARPPSPIEIGPELLSSPTMPPPFSLNCRTSSLQLSLPNRTRSSMPSTVNQHDGPDQSPSSLPAEPSIELTRVDTTPLRRISPRPSLSVTSSDMQRFSSIPNDFYTMGSTPYSLPSTPTKADASLSQTSFSFPSSPQTPVRVLPRSEPRNASRHGVNDTFGVYNDRLPAETQPQTPADLQSSRRRTIAERNVAYTAPPGQIRTTGRLIGIGYDSGHGAGPPSPTVGAERRRRK